MIDDTINDGKTIAGGGKDVMLAGRYHIIWQLECSGVCPQCTGVCSRSEAA